MIITLNEILNAASEVVHLDRREADLQFGAGLFDKAIAHHKKRNLRANVSLGTVHDKHGQKSKFINYNWAHVYDGAPRLIWRDFFLPDILNSCSRMARGFNP